MYWPTSDALEWSTRIPGATAAERWRDKELPHLDLFRLWSTLTYLCLILMALLSLPYWRTYDRNAKLVLLGIPVMNWICYAIVFSATARYRFTAEVVFCMLAGSVVSTWLASRRAQLPPGRAC